MSEKHEHEQFEKLRTFPRSK